MFLTIAILCSIYGNGVQTSDECNYLDYLGKKFDLGEIGCPQNRFCNNRRVIKVQYIRVPMYFYDTMGNEERMHVGGNFQKPVHQLLRRCCSCLNITEMTVLNSIAELNASSSNDADFIFPVFSRASREKMHGYYYIPLIDIPGMMYASIPPKIDLANIFIQVFPVCVVNILLCVVAGFICWLMETWGNIEEFRRGFLIGWYNGFWWAFVSMTTVGYGDKAPRSFIGRMYSVIWITIGIVAYGLLTGIVYTEVSKVNSPPPADMSGKIVGSLLFRDYDAMIIGDNAGWAVQNTNNEAFANFYVDFLYLVQQLEEKKINGIALDQFTFSHIFWWKAVCDKAYACVPGANEEQIKFVADRLAYMDHLVTVNIPQTTTQTFTYGIWVKSYDDYLYLKGAAEDLRYTIRREWRQAFQGIKMLGDKETDNIFYSAKNELYSHTGAYFRNTLIAIAVLVGVMCIFGVFYELKTRGKREQTAQNGTSGPV